VININNKYCPVFTFSTYVPCHELTWKILLKKCESFKVELTKKNDVKRKKNIVEKKYLKKYEK